MVIAGVVGVGLGWLFPQFQHHLYTEPGFRAAPAAGRKLLVLRLFCVAAAGISLALAFRPDFYEFGPAALTAGFLLVLVALSSTDFERKRIPNKLTYPAFAIALAVCWAWPDRTAADVLTGCAVAISIGIGFFALGLVVGAALRVDVIPFGIGDAKLILLAGAVVGWPGIVPVVTYGVVLGGVLSASLIMRRRWRAVFSYGPFFAAGAAIVMLAPGLR